MVGTGIRRLALELRPHVERRLLLVTPLVGLAVGVLAVIYGEASGDSFSDVLFSGQDALGPLIANSDDYSVAALLLLVACKGLATARRWLASGAGRCSRRCSWARALKRRPGRGAALDRVARTTRDRSGVSG